MYTLHAWLHETFKGTKNIQYIKTAIKQTERENLQQHYGRVSQGITTFVVGKVTAGEMYSWP